MSLPRRLYWPPFAHRGLWRPAGPPENSLPAFEAACRGGFGIELDVRLSADGEAMVFHDESLERMAGVEGDVHDFSAREIGALALAGGTDRIPTLTAVLERVAGRAMLLVEIKAAAEQTAALAARTAEILDRHDAAAAVISFDAAALAWFARERPDRPRGLDAAWLSDHDLEDREGQAHLQAFEAALETARPDFLVLEMESAEGGPAARRRGKDMPVIAWTVRSAEDAARVSDSCDNFIFEGFSP